MTATTTTAAKFTVVTDEGDTKTYSRKIDAMTAAERFEDEGVACNVINPKGVVIHEGIEADDDEDGIECPQCGDTKDETAFPTMAAKKGEASRGRNYDECRSCRNDRLASGGHKIPQVCTIACRQSVHAADDEHSTTCQCVCGGAFHGTEAPAVVA